MFEQLLAARGSRFDGELLDEERGGLSEAIDGDDLNAEDFADLCGKEMAKRAVMIAAAGRHNLLMFGPFTPLALTPWQLAA